MTEEDSQHFVSLRTYFDTRINALQKELEQALKANATAIQKAEQATEYRLANLNEFRASLADQTAQQATKQELEAIRTTTNVRIEALRESHAAKIEALQRIVYLGLGALTLLQFLIQAGLFKWGN